MGMTKTSMLAWLALYFSLFAIDMWFLGERQTYSRGCEDIRVY